MENIAQTADTAKSNTNKIPSEKPVRIQYASEAEARKIDKKITAYYASVLKKLAE